MRYLVGKAALAAWLIVGSLPAMAQEADDGPSVPDQVKALKAISEQVEAMKAAPVSPNGRPMEAVWDRAPEASDGEFTGTGPYFVSRWGGIVIRGRRNGDLVDRALAAKHCGASNNPATDITFIGEAPPNICEGVTTVAPGETQLLSSPVTLKGRDTQYRKLGTRNGWVVLEFLQNIDDIVRSGRAPATGEAASEWGISSLGAFYRNEDGKHVFYAPGETVKLVDDYSFTVEPVMDDEELQAKASAAIMNSMATDPAIAKIGRQEAKTPWDWAFLLVFGVPLAAIGGVIYGIRRFFRRRHGMAPATPAVTIAPADIPVGKRVADVVKADGAAMAIPPKPSDGAAWWRAQPLAKRRTIIFGTTTVLVLVILFVTLRPAEPDETALLRKVVAGGNAASAPSALGMTPNEEPLPTADGAGANAPSPADGHVGRFAVYRPANAKLLFDTFMTPAATDAALAAIHDHGPQEVMLLPAGSGAATSFAEPMGARGHLALNFECRRTAAYLYCMTRPRRTAMLLTVRVPNDTDQTVDGVNDAKTLVATEAQQAIDRLNAAGIGGQWGS
jgi:hypothetical protein